MQSPGQRTTTVAAPNTRSIRVWRRRTGAQRFVLVTSAATILILAFALSAIVGLSARVPLAALHTTVAEGPQIEVAETLTAPLAGNASAQDAGVRRVIAKTFRGAALTVTRTVTSASKNSDAEVAWAIAPNARTTTLADLDDIAYGYRHIDDAVSNDSAARSAAARLSGRGATTVAAMRGSVAAVRAVLPIPVVVLSLAGLIALVLCTQLLAASRENETRLLRARGGAIATIVRADARETAVTAVVAALIGAGAAQLMLFFIAGAPAGIFEVAAPPVAAVVAAVAVSAVGAWRAARAASGAPRPSAGRARIAFSWSFTVLLLAVAGIALWRFLLNGTPTPDRPEDAAAVLAPAALLCAAAMVGLVLLTPLVGRLESATGRARGLRGTLPIRQIHRSLGLFAGPVALIILAIGTTTVASGYSATWSRYLSDSAWLTGGSNIRAAFGGPAVAADASELIDRTPYEKAAHVTAVAPVLRESDTLGDETVTVVGVDSGQLGALVRQDSQVIDAPALSRTLVTAVGPHPQPGIALPATASAVRVGFVATEFDEVAVASPNGASVIPSVWIADPVGDLAPLTLASVPVGSDAHPVTTTATAPLPPGGPWTIVAIDARVDAPKTLAGFTFSVANVGATVGGTVRDVAIPSTQKWTSQVGIFGAGTSSGGKPGTISYSLTAIVGDPVDNTGVRLMPEHSDRVPVVLSGGLAGANHFHRGDHFDVDGQWASFHATVAGVVPLVPGVTTDASMLADLPALENGWLRTSEQVPALHELWIASDSPAESVGAVTRIAEPNAHVTAASGVLTIRFISSAVASLWLGAGGAAAFAIISLLASVATILRRRSGEVAVLRALGLTAGQQVRMRRLEVAIIAIYSLVVGAATGAVVLGLIVATLARASTPAAPPALTVHAGIDLVSIGAVVLALLVGAIVVMAPYEAAIRLRASGRATSGGEQ